MLLPFSDSIKILKIGQTDGNKAGRIQASWGRHPRDKRVPRWPIWSAGTAAGEKEKADRVADAAGKREIEDPEMPVADDDVLP